MTAPIGTARNPLFTPAEHRAEDVPIVAPAIQPADGSGNGRFGRLARAARDRLYEHRVTWLVLGPLLLAGGLMHGLGMDDSPQRIDDEGTYTAQAWAVFHLHQLTHYTYWYDHPPLGWLQLAGYAQLTGAFDRTPYAVPAGREFMLVVQLVSTVLLWTLARRIGLPRWGAGLAVALFAISPLAVQFHRTVYLDNIATPWLLAAFVLALTPRRRLAAFAGAGLWLAVAVLTKETSLLLLPILAWVLWRNSAGTTRRYAIVVSASVFVLAGAFFVLFALLKGEVVPGVNRTSLFGGMAYQLADRGGSGNIFQTGTLGNATVRQWLGLDVVLPLISIPAALIGLAVSRLRPFAVGYLLLLGLILRPGYLPVPYVIAMLPFAALLVAGAAVAGWEYRRPTAALTVLAGLSAVVFAVPAWSDQFPGFVKTDADQPMVEATVWIRANLPHNEPILTDDALWVDLVDSGFARRDVTWFYKPDTDPTVAAGWRNYDWVISTASVRSFPATSPTLLGALRNSIPVATFGHGGGSVQVRRIKPGGLPDASARQAQRVADGARVQAARALATNRKLNLSASVGAELRAGDVDPRLLTVLAAVTATHSLTIEDIPQVAGEAASVRRTAVISAVDGRSVSAGGPALTTLRRQLTGQRASYRPQLRLTGAGPSARLVVSFPIALP